MADLTADDVYTQLSAVIDKWHNFLDEQREWYGGPDADNDTDPEYGATPGKRPLSDDVGNTSLIDTPAELERRVRDAIASLNLQEDPAAFEQRVNDTLNELQALKVELLALQSDLDAALPLAQEAMDLATETSAEMKTIYQELLDLKNSAKLSEENALQYALYANGGTLPSGGGALTLVKKGEYVQPTVLTKITFDEELPEGFLEITRDHWSIVSNESTPDANLGTTAALRSALNPVAHTNKTFKIKVGPTYQNGLEGYIYAKLSATWDEYIQIARYTLEGVPIDEEVNWHYAYWSEDYDEKIWIGLDRYPEESYIVVNFLPSYGVGTDETVDDCAYFSAIELPLPDIETAYQPGDMVSVNGEWWVCQVADCVSGPMIGSTEWLPANGAVEDLYRGEMGSGMPRGQEFTLYTFENTIDAKFQDAIDQGWFYEERFHDAFVGNVVGLRSPDIDHNEKTSWQFYHYCREGDIIRFFTYVSAEYSDYFLVERRVSSSPEVWEQVIVINGTSSPLVRQEGAYYATKSGGQYFRVSFVKDYSSSYQLDSVTLTGIAITSANLGSVVKYYDTNAGEVISAGDSFYMALRDSPTVSPRLGDGGRRDNQWLIIPQMTGRYQSVTRRNSGYMRPFDIWMCEATAASSEIKNIIYSPQDGDEITVRDVNEMAETVEISIYTNNPDHTIEKPRLEIAGETRKWRFSSALNKWEVVFSHASGAGAVNAGGDYPILVGAKTPFSPTYGSKSTTVYYPDRVEVGDLCLLAVVSKAELINHGNKDWRYIGSSDVSPGDDINLEFRDIKISFYYRYYDGTEDTDNFYLWRQGYLWQSMSAWRSPDGGVLRISETDDTCNPVAGSYKTQWASVTNNTDYLAMLIRGMACANLQVDSTYGRVYRSNHAPLRNYLLMGENLHPLMGARGVVGAMPIAPTKRSEGYPVDPNVADVHGSVLLFDDSAPTVGLNFFIYNVPPEITPPDELYTRVGDDPDYHAYGLLYATGANGVDITQWTVTNSEFVDPQPHNELYYINSAVEDDAGTVTMEQTTTDTRFEEVYGMSLSSVKALTGSNRIGLTVSYRDYNGSYSSWRSTLNFVLEQLDSEGNVVQTKNYSLQPGSSSSNSNFFYDTFNDLATNFRARVEVTGNAINNELLVEIHEVWLGVYRF